MTVLNKAARVAARRMLRRKGETQASVARLCAGVPRLRLRSRSTGHTKGMRLHGAASRENQVRRYPPGSGGGAGADGASARGAAGAARARACLDGGAGTFAAHS